MKVKLEFNLEEPEDYALFKRTFSKCEEFKFALWDILQKMREELKYNENLTQEEARAYEKVQKDIFDILEGYEILETIQRGD